MKRIQQYCSVADRLKQDPACKQEVLARASRSKISVSRRGMITGTAVAALLLALNIGGGYVLHRSAEESGTVTSEASEELVTAVMTATTAPGTDITAVVTKAVTDHSAVTKTVTNRQTNTVTTGNQTVQTGTTVPAATTARPEMTAASATETTPRTTLTTAAVTAAQTTTVPEKPNPAAVTPEAGTAQRAVFGIIPSDNIYQSASDLGLSNNVCHAAPGQTLLLGWMVWNDPGISCTNLRLITTLPLEITNYNPYTGYASPESYGTNLNRSMLSMVYNSSEKEPSKPEACICFLQVNVPEQKGRYSITLDPENKNTVYSDPEQKNPVSYEFYGLDIVVDEDGTAAEKEEEQHTWGEIRIVARTVKAQPGEKNVPVDIYVEKNTGFAGATLLFPSFSGITPSLEQNNEYPQTLKLDVGELFSDITAAYDSDTDESSLVLCSDDGSNVTRVGKLCTLYVNVPEEAQPGETLKIWLVPYLLVDTNGMPISERCESVAGGIKIVDNTKPMHISDDFPIYRF